MICLWLITMIDSILRCVMLLCLSVCTRHYIGFGLTCLSCHNFVSAVLGRTVSMSFVAIDAPRYVVRDTRLEPALTLFFCVRNRYFSRAARVFSGHLWCARPTRSAIKSLFTLHIAITALHVFFLPFHRKKPDFICSHLVPTEFSCVILSWNDYLWSLPMWRWILLHSHSAITITPCLSLISLTSI